MKLRLIAAAVLPGACFCVPVKAEECSRHMEEGNPGSGLMNDAVIRGSAKRLIPEGEGEGGGTIISRAKSSPEYYDLVWMIRNKGCLNKTEHRLRSEGFEYIPRRSMYRKEPVPAAAEMTCIVENGEIKKTVIHLTSCSSAEDAVKRYMEYRTNFENQLQGLVKAECKTFDTAKTGAGIKAVPPKAIAVYDLEEIDFMVAVYVKKVPDASTYIVCAGFFPKKYYSDTGSVFDDLSE